MNDDEERESLIDELSLESQLREDVSDTFALWCAAGCALQKLVGPEAFCGLAHDLAAHVERGHRLAGNWSAEREEYVRARIAENAAAAKGAVH